MKLLSTIVCGLLIGAILALADRYGLLPWAVGYMLAALATNVRMLTRL
jgi:hypothetical protein